MRSAIGLAAILAVLGSATTSFSQVLQNEVIYVEPANRQILFNMMNAFWSAPPVQRPETICGNPSGSPSNLVPCYEFWTTYISFNANGDTVIHLPQCNGTHPLDADCTSNNLCASLTGVPRAPICGDLQAAIRPLTSEDALTLGPNPVASWDGVSVGGRGQVWINTQVNGVNQSMTFNLPVIRIPASQVKTGGGSVLGLLEGIHTNLEGTDENFGFFSVLHRILTFDPLIGDISNAAPTPLLF